MLEEIQKNLLKIRIIYFLKKCKYIMLILKEILVEIMLLLEAWRQL
jgi:hypothetical protein